MMGPKRFVVIAGSPKPAGTAVSDFLAKHAQETLQAEGAAVRVVNARQTLLGKQTAEAFAEMAAADALIVIFPLYVFCLPGMLMRFLQQYQAYVHAHPEAKRGAAVYAVVNCGFPEPEINSEAVGVIGRFAEAVGARFRFGVMIGSGGMITLNVPPSKRQRKQYQEAMEHIAAEVASGEFKPAQPVYLRNGFPAKLYFKFAEAGWRRMIRQNGKQVQDLYARPYQN